MTRQIPTRKFINSKTGETYELPYNWVNMEGKSRKKILEDIRQAFSDMHTLDYENIDDLLYQLQDITTPNSDDPERENLRLIADRAREDLENVKRQRSQNAKCDIMRSVLNDIKSDLDIHLQRNF